MHTNGCEISYVCTIRSKGRVYDEPLTYEQTQKTCSNHLSTGSKGCVHQEHKPLNDEQVNMNISLNHAITTLYEIDK
jgi:hypothetical protein